MTRWIETIFQAEHTHTHTHTLRTWKLPMVWSTMVWSTMVWSTMMAVSWMNPEPIAINLAYDGITQKCWCLWSDLVFEIFFHRHNLSVLNSDCLLAEQVFHRLDVEMFSTPSKHRWNHPFLSWHNSYHLSYTPIACKSTFRTSLHLFFAPWHGLFMLSSPNNNLFGSLSSSMRPTWPSHLKLCSRMISEMECCKPNLCNRLWDVNLSFHCWYLVTPRIVRIQRLWKDYHSLVLNFLNFGSNTKESELL